MEHSTTKVVYALEENPQSPIIHKKIYKIDNKEYVILTYQKKYVGEDDTDIGRYRSVIFTKGELVCFSPPKSISLYTFMRNHLCSNSFAQPHSNVDITDIIEGTMINLFYDFIHGTWEIATKNAVGGRYWYFNNTIKSCDNTTTTTTLPKKTFRDMFMEAIHEKDYTNLNHTALVEGLDRHCCYSFILQHPENHFVFNIETPAIYLAAMYKIEKNTAIYYSLPYVRKLTCITNLIKNNIIYLPDDTHTIKTYNEQDQCLTKYIGEMYIHTDTGIRTKTVSEKYKYRKQLRGNNPCLQYQYLCLLRTTRIEEFLQYFPDYKKQFQEFKEQFDQFIQSIHNAYFMYYVNRQRDNMKHLKHTMYFIKKIHQAIFLKSKENNQHTIVTKEIVHDWMLSNYEPSVLLYHIRLPNRE